jgi:endonuclease/exonuclease/phosphatase family metal-dependent hydrolase
VRVTRVATFNVRHGARPCGMVSTRALVRSCLDLDADVLALQELDERVVRSAFRDQAAVVGRALDLRRAVVRTKRTPVGGWQCNALLTRHSLVDVERVPLPSAAARESRVALLSDVVGPAGRAGVAVVHLDTRRAAAREQLETVLAALANRPGPRILAGDCNLEAGDLVPRLAAAGLRPAGSAATYPAASPRRQIDWIATDAGFTVLRVSAPPAPVSDHRPLVADLARAGGSS